MGSQRVGHDLVTEQQTKQQPVASERIRVILTGKQRKDFILCDQCQLEGDADMNIQSQLYSTCSTLWFTNNLSTSHHNTLWIWNYHLHWQSRISAERWAQVSMRDWYLKATSLRLMFHRVQPEEMAVFQARRRPERRHCDSKEMSFLVYVLYNL